jgi:hypothetical protein
MPDILKLEEMQGQILGSVKRAAEDGDVSAVSRWSKYAEQCKALIEENEDLETRIVNFCNFFEQARVQEENGEPNPADPGDKQSPETNISSKQEADNDSEKRKPPWELYEVSDDGWYRYRRPSPNSGDPDAKHHTGAKISKQQVGKTGREKWVSYLELNHGVKLKGRGKRFETPDGTSVAIAFANKTKEANWFLGLKDEETDVAVLICNDSAGKEHSIILPVAEINEEWGQLKRGGKNREIKLNFNRTGDIYVLKIPAPFKKDMDVTKYLDNYDPLVK